MPNTPFPIDEAEAVVIQRAIVREINEEVLQLAFEVKLEDPTRLIMETRIAILKALLSRLDKIFPDLQYHKNRARV